MKEIYNSMNTFDFDTVLAREYFIEDICHEGWRKDKGLSDTYATTYYHSRYPSYKIVLRVGALSADVYCNDVLIIHKHNETLQAA
jgi:hypothetical protein